MTPEERYTENEPLIVYVMRRYYPSLIKNEDLQQEARIGLWRACLAYDDSRKETFMALAIPYIRNAISGGYQKLYGRSMNRRYLFWNMRSLEEEVDVADAFSLLDIITGDPDVGYLDVSGMMTKMTQREIEIFQRWVWGETRDEIAEDLGICKRTIWRALDKVKKLYDQYI